MKYIDIKNQKFGRLTAKKRQMLNKRAYWHCICECGKKVVVRFDGLRRNKSRSCGCLGRDVTIARLTTHNMSGTSTHNSWRQMLNRCYGKNIPDYKNYGARGIKVCKRWHKFENFYKDMGIRPKLTSIDRINNKKGYFPKNCRWATKSIQQNNRSNTIKVIYKNREKSLSDWCREFGLRYCKVYHPLRNKGLSFESILKNYVK